MGVDKKPTLSEIFLQAGAQPDPSDDSGQTWLHKMLREEKKTSVDRINVDALIQACNSMKDTIEVERLRLESQLTQAKKNREDWLKAGMPLKKPLKITNKPLKLNKT